MADIRQDTNALDDFDRANEAPLSHGGDWARTDSVWIDDLDLADQGATHSLTNTFGASYWIPDAWDGDDAEFWGSATGGNAPGVFWGIGLFQQAGGSNAIDGYEFQTRFVTGGITYHLYKVTNGSYTQVAAAGPAGGAQYKLIRRNGNDVEAWVSDSFGASWAPAVSVTDTDFVTGLQGSISVSDNTGARSVAWDLVGGGPRREVRRQQIYRVIRGTTPIQ